MTEAPVRVWEQHVEILTYGTGAPDKNPMFLEKRVYQGSSGKVYPYPVIDKIQDEKHPVAYHIVYLENEYLHIEILPELGGRIYRAQDKTNGYDFVYYNRVIKPALVGLAGPWIAGGIEFNWPQHHRPNTFGQVEYCLVEESDGRGTVWVSEIDRMYGTKMLVGFTLHPGKAYLEVKVQLSNRTPEPQTFLWWANSALAAHEQTQAIFPPDVHAVLDSDRRTTSDFPIAKGMYNNVDYSAGVDISRAKNIPVPTSYMASHSDYNFLGNYDYRAQAGLLHIANHHISPGKKQWTWGSGEAGRIWERNLTDEDGPSLELMTGVYSGNQPDFSWLQPYEEKSFQQYFLPYKNLGVVKNASIDAAVNLEVDTIEHKASLQTYATALFADARITLVGKARTYVDATVTISPTRLFSSNVVLEQGELPEDLQAQVRDDRGHLLISYQPEKATVASLSAPAQALPAPEHLANNEALYLAGLHLEQYRHATCMPDPYYLEGLKHDPGDARINVAYGRILLRRGLFRESEEYFRRAIASLTRYNANSYDGEAYYQLGLTLKLQDRLDDAFTAFYKAVWSSAWQDSGYFSLAQIACTRQEYTQALDLVERSLVRNVRNYRARHLKATLLRKLGHPAEAESLVRETLTYDIADFGAAHEQYLLALTSAEESRAANLLLTFTTLLRAEPRNFIALAVDYSQAGLYEEAIAVLRLLVQDEQQEVYPMLRYYLATFYYKSGQAEQAAREWQLAATSSPDYCFPNSLDDLLALQSALATHPDDAMAHYYLGNLLYDKQRHVDAVQHWEAARELNNAFATVHRNLALAYYNALGQPELALVSLETAFACDPTDARVCYELDQLYKKLGLASEQRLARLDAHWELVTARDDLYLEYVTLVNTLQDYTKALSLLAERKFHPWEGGEGKISAQYVLASVEQGKHALLSEQYVEAAEILQRALVYPENLGEVKLTGTQENHIYYYLGCTYRELDQTEKARECFQAASHGPIEPASVLFSNDQPPDMLFYQGLAWLKLDAEHEAQQRFQKLIDYGTNHLFDLISVDYFAVSLPDFLVFEDDLQKRNLVHCFYMQGLGYLGMQRLDLARTHLARALELDTSHQGVRIHLAITE